MKKAGRAVRLAVCGFFALSWLGAIVFAAEKPYAGIGTLKPYERFGKVYRPILPADAADYRERGNASWYGDDFHGLPTSTGEVYNMHDMTAAHKTLPLGLFVKVTRRNDGRSVIVRLNDRGPFVDSRIIDLSFAAAKELGMERIGVTPVEVEVLGYPVYEGETLTFRRPDSYDAPAYSVQVAAFKMRENADAMAARFVKASLPAKIVEFRKKDELFYRVRVGNFRHIADAEGYRDLLRKNGYPNTFVVGE